MKIENNYDMLPIKRVELQYMDTYTKVIALELQPDIAVTPEALSKYIFELNRLLSNARSSDTNYR